MIAANTAGPIDVCFRQRPYSGRPGARRQPFVLGLEVAGTARELGEGRIGSSARWQVIVGGA